MTSLSSRFVPMKRLTAPKHNYYKVNYDHINDEIAKIVWCKALSHLTADISVGVFYDLLYSVIRTHVPLIHAKSSRFLV